MKTLSLTLATLLATTAPVIAQDQAAPAATTPAVTTNETIKPQPVPTIPSAIATSQKSRWMSRPIDLIGPPVGC